MGIQLSLQNINQKFYGENLFEEDVSLTIQKNKATLLYGGSGSGKTSLLNILIGITQPYKGELFWGDEKIDSLQKANKLRATYMSVIFSNFSFIAELSVEENILLAASLCKVENAQEKLYRFADTLLHFEDKNIDLRTLMQKTEVTSLSNGQKEIISIASALLLETDFFIADEMLRSFPEDTKEILFKRLLAYFQENGVGFFYVTHWDKAQTLLKESDYAHEIYYLKNKKIQLKDKG